MCSNQKFENGVNADTESGLGLDVKPDDVNNVNVNVNTKITSSSDVRNIKVAVGDLPPEQRNGDLEGVRSFIQEIKDDLKNKDLIPLKVLFFFKYATVFVLYPFMTLHLKSLGLDETEAGLNSAIIPMISIFGPPFAGIVADRIGNFKLLLAGITLANAPLALILLLVPIARETVLHPENMNFSLRCATTDNSYGYPFILRGLDSNSCTINPTSSFENMSTAILQCGKMCSVNSTGTNNINKNLNLNLNFSNELPPLPSTEMPLGGGRYFLLPDQKTFFIPTKRKPDLICEGTKCSIQFATEIEMHTNQTGNNELSQITAKFTKFRYLSESSDMAKENVNVNVTHPEFAIAGKFIFDEKEFSSEVGLTCSDESETIRIGSARLTEINSICTNQCLLQLKRDIFCSDVKEELKIYNVSLTFWMYTVVRVFLGLASATSFIMFEGAVIAILKEYGGDYGLQRVTATLAAIIFAPLSGVLIQVFEGFTAAFCLYTVLQLICVVLTMTIDLEFKPPAERILGRLKEILSQAEILIFFGAIFVSGTAWGYLESFFFWFLQDLGGSKILMGFTISIGGLAGIPLLILSRPLIKMFGHVNILCVGLFFYGVRLIGYSFIENPLWCLPFEAMEALTASLAITAAATYAAALSSKQTIASVQGIWGGLYFGIGRSSGSLFGGYFIKWYGSRRTFQIFALMAFIGALLYFIVNILYIKKYSKAKYVADSADLSTTFGEKKKRDHHPGKLHVNSRIDKFDSGYIVPCDLEKFTNVPLDEECTPEGKLKFEKVRPRSK